MIEMHRSKNLGLDENLGLGKNLGLGLIFDIFW